VKMWATVGSSFLVHSLRHAGASNVRVITLEVTPDGDRFQQRTYAVPVEILWDVPGE